MRAARFHENGGPEVLRVETVPMPEPGPGEVRISVRAAALNHLDLWVRRGLPIDTPMPHIGGSDIAGVVDSVGDGVEASWMGRRVVVDPSLDYSWYESDRADGPQLRVIGEHTQGGFAEYVTVPAANLLEVPDSVEMETAAAAALSFVTAWHALAVRAGLRKGERVLVTGASGGVASAAIQIGVHLGAEVFATTSGPENVRRVRDLGAVHVYDRERQDFSEEIWRETEKRGVHVVLDAVGEAIWSDALRVLAPTGRLVTFGATTGPRALSDLRLVFWRQLSILGSTMGSPEDFRTVMQLVFDGTLAPVIDRRFPLEKIEMAHRLLESGDIFGKILIDPIG